MGYRHHGVDTGGLPIEYIKRFIEKFPIEVFIETGTAGGESVRAASNIFTFCHSIEVVEGRADGSYPPNVKLWTGDSVKLLSEVTRPFTKSTHLFFLVRCSLL